MITTWLPVELMIPWVSNHYSVIIYRNDYCGYFCWKLRTILSTSKESDVNGQNLPTVKCLATVIKNFHYRRNGHYVSNRNDYCNVMAHYKYKLSHYGSLKMIICPLRVEKNWLRAHYEGEVMIKLHYFYVNVMKF